MAIIDGKIRCSACRVWKPLADYMPSTVRLGNGRCRPCMKEKFKPVYAANREAFKAKRNAHRAANREATREVDRAYKASHRRERLDYYLRSTYGIGLEEYERLFAEQGGKCACCGAPPGGRRLDVDHDHATGAVRSLLCRECNAGIGIFREDPERLRLAIEYLLRFIPAVGVA